MNVLFQSLVSETTLRFLAPFILLLVGVFIETRYVGRVAMFTNAAALYIFYHPIDMTAGLGFIVNAVIIIGLIGGISRVSGFSLPGQFYQIAWIASSAATALLLLHGLTL